MSDIIKRLRFKAGMIQMGERIEWGSDSGLMYEAADMIEQLMARDEEQYTPADMADQGARGWRDGYAWAKGDGCMEAAAPDAQGEPVGEVRFELGAPSFVYGKIYSDAAPHLAPGAKLYVGLQRAQQPAPDVSALVEALEEISDPIRFMEERLEEGERLNGMAAVQLAGDASYLRGIARAVLAAHRKQQETNHDNQ